MNHPVHRTRTTSSHVVITDFSFIMSSSWEKWEWFYTNITISTSSKANIFFNVLINHNKYLSILIRKKHFITNIWNVSLLFCSLNNSLEAVIIQPVRLCRFYVDLMKKKIFSTKSSKDLKRYFSEHTVKYFVWSLQCLWIGWIPRYSVRYLLYMINRAVMHLPLVWHSSEFKVQTGISWDFQLTEV